MNKNLISYLIAGILISAPLYPNWIKSPETLSIWLKANITYQAEEDGEDYWKTPEETVKDGTGDCEDIAFLANKILLDLKYNTQVIAVYFENYGHAICLIKENNKYTYFSNQYYYSTQYDSLRELLDNRYINWIGYRRLYQCGLMGYYNQR